jgi:hypothetical protein
MLTPPPSCRSPLFFSACKRQVLLVHLNYSQRKAPHTAVPNRIVLQHLYMTAALTALVRAVGNDERMLREAKDDLMLRIMAGVQHHLHRSGLHDVGLLGEPFAAPSRVLLHRAFCRTLLEMRFMTSCFLTERLGATCFVR